MLFEVAILKKATKKEIEDGGKAEELVFGPTPVVARDAQAAGMLAAMSAAFPKDLELSRAEVLVRPFA
jgi:hypothetical protein